MFLGSHFAAPIIGIMFLESRKKQMDNAPSLSTSKYLVLGLLGMMPDMLYPHFGGGSHYQSYAHSIWAFILFAGGILLFSKFLIFNLSVRYRVYMILALFSHYFIDLFSGGIKWLYPFSDGKIGYAVIPLGTWVALDFTLVIAMLLMLKYRNRKKFITAGKVT